MYVTRPLSLYKNNPSAISLPPPEGPSSGYLVIQDDDPRHFFGLFKDNSIRHLPFPQNKLHVVTHGSQKDKTHYDIYFIPVVDQPLSSSTYYAIKTKGGHKGEACASSTDEEMTSCCIGNCVNDVKPRPLDPTNAYQHFKVSTYENWHSSGFVATSIAPDGHPPSFLRRKGWDLDSKTPKNFSLGEASGLDPRLRARLPEFTFPLSYTASTPVVVGKWYCPFVFIKDVLTPREQVKRSMYYEMTLEQQWKRVFFCNNENAGSGKGNSAVFVDVSVPTESVMVAEMEGVQVNQDNGANQVVWFNSLDGRVRAGLSSLVVRRIMWEEERVGWVSEVGKQEKVVKIEEFGGKGMWARYGCYMLVETFVLKRMDGSVVLRYSFNHTHQIRSKWE